MQNDFKDYDWEGLLKRLPIKKTVEERTKRRQLWNAIDMNGNGYISLAEFDRGVRDVLNLPHIFSLKKVLIRAYNASKNKIKGKAKHSGDYVEWLEFRILLVYLRQYFEYYAMFCRIDTSDDFKVDINEFKKAVPILEKWGVKITDPNAEFKKIDTNNSGSIMFDEFCEYAIKKNLDLEDDDDFEDEELKTFKSK
jgi:Ca2+-binding EF-hand superfamily protein